MQLVGTISSEVKTDHSRSWCWSSVLLLAIPFAIVLNILPALASEPAEISEAGRAAHDRVTAVARAQIVRPFDYIPVADTDGIDQNVSHIKLPPRGTLLPTSSEYEHFSISFRMKVK